MSRLHSLLLFEDGADSEIDLKLLAFAVSNAHEDRVKACLVKLLPMLHNVFNLLIFGACLAATEP